MKLYTFAGNTHALQTLIVARYNGVDIEVPAFEMGKDNKSAAFLKKSPLGKVPVLETASGCICEAAAVARLHARSRSASSSPAPSSTRAAPHRYVARMRADTNMFGATFFEAGQARAARTAPQRPASPRLRLITPLSPAGRSIRVQVDMWVEFAKNELGAQIRETNQLRR